MKGKIMSNSNDRRSPFTIEIEISGMEDMKTALSLKEKTTEFIKEKLALNGCKAEIETGVMDSTGYYCYPEDHQFHDAK